MAHDDVSTFGVDHDAHQPAPANAVISVFDVDSTATAEWMVGAAYVVVITARLRYSPGNAALIRAALLSMSQRRALPSAAAVRATVDSGYDFTRSATTSPCSEQPHARPSLSAGEAPHRPTHPVPAPERRTATNVEVCRRWLVPQP